MKEQRKEDREESVVIETPMPQNLAKAHGVLTPVSVREVSVETPAQALCGRKERSIARRPARQKSKQGDVSMGQKV
jgi:hypothetical protein